MKINKLTFWIFLALFLGIIFGWLFPEYAVKFEPLANAFLRMIKMIIAPLLFATLTVGIAGHGDIKTLGKIGIKTIIYFEIVTTIALLIGLSVAHIFAPGKGFNLEISESLLNSAKVISQTNTHSSFADMVMHIVPNSIVEAMCNGNLLQIVVFAIFFAFSICAVGQKAQPVLDVLKSLADIMFKFTEYVMLFAPIGVFAAITSTIGENGVGILKTYAKIIVW